MSFEKQIQQWVSLDNQIKILNEKTRDLRSKKMKSAIIFFNMLKQTNYPMPL